MADDDVENGIEFSEYLRRLGYKFPSKHADKPQPVAKPAPKEKEVKRPSLTPLEATIVLARRGNTQVLPMLRRALDEHPEIWQTYGNLAAQSQASWIGMVAGKDLLLQESVRKYSEAMQADIAGPNPSPLEKLLAQRVVSCWLQMQWCEAMEAQRGGGQNLKVAEFQMKRASQAHRDYLAAMKMLSTVRNLMAKTRTIQVEMVHRTAAPATTGPIIAAHGESSPVGDKPAVPENHVNGATKPKVNGSMNGFHNRISALLEPAAAE